MVYIIFDEMRSKHKLRELVAHEGLIEEDKLCESVQQKKTVEKACIHWRVTSTLITNHPTEYSGNRMLAVTSIQ